MENSDFIRKIQKKIGRGINRYNLIQENDKVLVGLSGGKDSLILLEVLSERRKWIPIKYDIEAIHVSVKNIRDKADINLLTGFCSNLSIPLHHREIDISLKKDSKKSICFLCSWHRRKEMFDAVKDLGMNKLAFGHHMDDVAETLLMNMIFNGSISGMPASLSFFGGEFDIIRPMILVPEDELIKYQEIKNLPVLESDCPHEKDNNRSEIKKIISDLKKINKNAVNNIFYSMGNIHDGYLPDGDEKLSPA